MFKTIKPKETMFTRNAMIKGIAKATAKDKAKTNQPKETMTNQQLKNKVILSMKKDNDLKKYVKDMQELSNESFDILVKIIDGAYNKVKGVK